MKNVYTGTLSVVIAVSIVLLFCANIALTQSCPSQPKDCQDILRSGIKVSGVYTIYPRGPAGFKAYCDMKTDGGGWTIFQRRWDGNPSFYRTWKEYQYGFGDVGQNHWLGNQKIHQLTSQGWYELRIDMSDFTEDKRYAKYRTFSVGSEASGYQLTVRGYQGNAGDSFTYHSGLPFYARDRDSSWSCSKRFKGGWWYREAFGTDIACLRSNLNGLYLRGYHSSVADGIDWETWRGHHYSLKTTEMKIRRK